jgi:phosphoribosylanthranilate isomerase
MIRVKICGIKTLDDALASLDAGADMLGLNFHPPSPRCLDRDAAARLTGHLRSRGARATLVGVFVNRPPAEVAEVMDECGLDLAQLSGDEPAEDLAALGPRAFKAIRAATQTDAAVQARRYRADGTAGPALLLDASGAPGSFGGTGQAADWDIAAMLAAELPLLLAGGLRPENVAAAVAAAKPWGVDVASGVESAPGVKDPAKMAAFVAAARFRQL